jgi:hypothetical protein
MATKRTPRPRDPIQLGKLMIDIATGAVPDSVDDGKDSAAGVTKTLWELADMVKVLEDWETRNGQSAVA